MYSDLTKLTIYKTIRGGRYNYVKLQNSTTLQTFGNQTSFILIILF